MIKFIKDLFKGHRYEVGQVVVLIKPFEYLGYLPVTFDLIPVFWVITDLLDHGRIKIRIVPILDTQAKFKNLKYYKKPTVPAYFPEHLDVEPKHLELAPDMIQILYGKSNNGQL